MKFKLGDTDIPFVFRGDEMMYPNPVKDGLVLWYDFSGRTNADGQRGIADDLSGNGNHGTLQNFNYTAESGYDKNKLLFDGVDDYIDSIKIGRIYENPFSLSVVFRSYDDNIAGSNILFSDKSGLFASPESGIDILLTRESRNLNIKLNDGISQFDLISNSSFNKEKSYSFSVVFLQSEVILYVNGEVDKKITTEFIPSSGSDRNLRLFGRYRYNNQKSKSDLKSIKLYNRPLTPEEVAHNYAIEKERFGIE